MDQFLEAASKTFAPCFPHPAKRYVVPDPALLEVSGIVAGLGLPITWAAAVHLSGIGKRTTDVAVYLKRQ